MSEKIGKYEIIERIGGSAAGTVYKAKDPRLGRQLAIRVITPEGELTDELRTKFFTEAQALAGLSHPNLVTIYDVDEEKNRLFVAMELLDGRELKRLLADKDLSVEDKISAMVQLCGAIQYLNGKGMFGCDIDPGHILTQPDGSVKIIDFSLARMAATPVMKDKAKRYPTPDHANGGADANSDQFALGSLFYELLSAKPPYSDDDPKRLLEKLQKEKPASLLDLDPQIPADVAKVIERAMSKNPAERFPDLNALRSELEVVQKRLVDEAQPLRERYAALVKELRESEASVAKRLGKPASGGPELPVEPAKNLAALQKHSAQAQGRINELRDTNEKLDVIEPKFRRGIELLEGEKYADARVEFQAVLGMIPDYAAATPALERARAGEERARRDQLTAKLLGNARKALEKKDGVQCLALIQEASEVPAPAEAEAEITTLRNAAKVLLAEQEASRRARQQAERAREAMVDAKVPASAQGAQKFAPKSWATAEEKASQGNAHFKAEKYSEALLAFDAATAAFQAAHRETGEAQERERRAAEEAENARRLKVTTEIIEEARAALAARAFLKCQEILKKALDVPPPDSTKAEIRTLSETAETALQTERRSKKPAQTARMLMSETRVSAQAEGGDSRSSSSWQEAETKAAAGEQAFAGEMFATAHEAFDAATSAYRLALEDARAAKRREKETADAARQQTSAQERKGLAARLIGEARSALDRGDFALCLDVVEVAEKVLPDSQQELAAIRRTAETGRKDKETSEQARQAEELEKQKAERARDLVVEAIRNLQRKAPETPNSAWEEIEAKVAEAHTAFAKSNYAAAFNAYKTGLEACRRVTGEPGEPSAPEAAPVQKSAEARAAAPAGQAQRAPEPPKPEPQKAAAPKVEPQKAEASKAEPPKAAPAQAAKAQAPEPAKPAPAVPAAPAAAAASVSAKADDATVRISSKPERAAGIKPPAAPARAQKKEKGKDDEDEVEPDRLASPMVLIAAAVLAAASVAYLLLMQGTDRTAPVAQPAPQAQSMLKTTPPSDLSAGRVELAPKAAAAPVAAAPAAAPTEEVLVASAVANVAAPAAVVAAAPAEVPAAPDPAAEGAAKVLDDARAVAEAKAILEARAAEDARLAEERATTEAKAAGERKLAADQKAAEAKAAMQAGSPGAAQAATDAATADAKAAADAKIAADTKAAQAVAAEEAAAKEAKVAAEKKAAAEAKAEEAKAKAAAAAKAAFKPELAALDTKSATATERGLVDAYASVFTAPTDGKKGGGGWGACWRQDPASARACAKQSCDGKSSQRCVETATGQPGGHCAVASASGFGVSWAACGATRAAADSSAIAGCSKLVGRNYKGERASCRIVWSTAKR